MNNSSGFQNESNLVIALNGKVFSDLNSNLQNLISYSFSNKNGIISCFSRGGNNKSDLMIQIGNEKHTFSIKKGSGNSVHQEPVNSFLLYLEKYFSLSEYTKNNILKFIWGDGTIDGSGPVSDRLSANDFTKKYPEIVDDIKLFFDKIKKDLIRRFVITGVGESSPAEFIYYGDVSSGFCCSSENALEWLSNNYSDGAIPVGRLTFQAWNRNINGGTKSEHKRGVIQLKWGKVKDDIKKI